MIRGKKILGALLAFTLCFSMVIPAQADDISDAKKKQQELEQQKNTAEAEKSELSSELDSIVSKMEKTQSDLTAKETEINDAETELVTAKANEDDQYQTMKLRIKYMYENGSNEFLEILMEANSIADLLNKAEYINKISKCDRELLVEYEDTRKDVENRENALKKEYAELESLQDELAGEQANVEKLLADKNIQIDNLTSEISSNADKLKQLIAAAEAAEARRKEAEATAAAQLHRQRRQLRHQLRQAQAAQAAQAIQAAMQVHREPDHLHIRYREQRLPVALADVWHRLQVQQPVMTESIMVQDTEQQFMRLIPVPLLPHSTTVHVEITS